MTDYVKLATDPTLILEAPLCGTCLVNVDEVDLDWLCPNCGTLWPLTAGNGDTGQRYESWSGEKLPGRGISRDRAADIALEREIARMRAHNERFVGRHPADRMEVAP